MTKKTTNTQSFKVLFLYPNFQMAHLLLPAGISILSAVLKALDFETKLFDTTLYRPKDKSFDDIRLNMLQLKKFNLKDSSVLYKDTNMMEDFIQMLEEFKPNLVATSILQDTFPIAIPLTREAKKRGIPVIAGGIMASFAPHDVIKEESIDFVCVGEGENALAELCQRMTEGRSTDNVQNLWVRKPDGSIIKNQMGPTVNVDSLPYSDYDIFEPARFYRSMQGKVMRILPVEMHRGCPYQCAFCEDPMLTVLYKRIDQRYHRAKSPRRLVDEIKYFVEKHQAEFIYFNAETFFAMPHGDFVKLADYYIKEIRLPFWLQTRPETITEERIKLLKEMNVAQVNIGLEHGNEEFRHRVLKRSMKNERIISGLSLLHMEGISTTVNNIMGFPDETRELIFDTIELNRHVQSATINAYLFNPYKGTELYKVCEDKGYLPKEGDERVIDGSLSEDFPYFKTVLNMPQISKEELCGLQRTFVLYAKLPREEWPRIRLAETFTTDGNKIFYDLREEYLGGKFEKKLTALECF